MVRLGGGVLLLSAILAAANPAFRNTHARPAQLILDTSGELQQQQQQISSGRKLKGKFLHITDFHPDPFYQVGATPKAPHPCHQGQGSNSTGFYGAPRSKCDSPFTLVEATFRWVKENVKDEIDFVIWTGDSARHDNDNDIPRSREQVLQLNEYIVSKFVEVFADTDNTNPINNFIIPIVPTLGNNDILPHNIFMPGPNRWSEEFATIWQQFIPQDQLHTFARGGWFSIEVIPNKLAVINLNTLYFFSSNAAVDGCELESEPGYEHFEWLRVQLQGFRERGMKAYLIGHVPPARTKSKRSWDETCYQKYILWQRQYRDVIVASLYGHMNIDHFMFHDTEDLQYKIESNQNDTTNLKFDDSVDIRKEMEFHIEGKAKYLKQLRDSWKDLPTPPSGLTYNAPVDSRVSTKKKSKHLKKFLKEIGGPHAERFTMSIVSPSVVPNYFPTLRIIEYNITGLENVEPATGVKNPRVDMETSFRHPQDYSVASLELELRKTENDLEAEGRRKGKKHKKKPKWPRKPNFKIPDPPSSGSIPGPAHSPQTLSLVSWTQMYANLTEIHENMVQDGFMLSQMNPEDAPQDPYKYFNYTVEYKTNKDNVYNLPDLTVRSWLSLAERIGRTIYQPSGLSLAQNPETPASAGDENSYGLDEANDEIEDDDGDDDDDEDEDDEDDEVVNDSNDEDEEDEEEDDSLIDSGIGSTKKGKHGKHKKKKHKHKQSGALKANQLWHDFLQRAYVGAKKEKYLKKHFN